MSRNAVVVWSLLVGALAGCDTFFPSGGQRTGTLSGLGPDGGVCEKDPQAIRNVMLAPPTCNATNPCPCGTFCSSQTGGNCVADCVDDTWCAPGYTCSGYGQCLAGGADGGAGDGGLGPNVNPSCPRNAGLLASLEVMHRSCQFDDVCPFGSHCDHVQERCRAECGSNADCAAQGSPGHTFVCGCLGTCVEVGATREPATTVLSTLEVTPRKFVFPRPQPLTAPVWGGTNARSISLVVVTPFVTTSGSTITGPTVIIRANPGAGLMVQCPGAGGPPSSAPCSFTVDPATFRSVNGEYRSDPIQMTLAPSPGAPTATNWDLRLTSNDLAGQPTVVNLRYLDRPSVASLNYQPIAAPPASFFGTGVVTMGTPLGATLTIPVKARTWMGELVLFDETRQLSPSGKLVMRVPTSVTNYQTYINPDLGNDVALQNEMVGVAFQKIIAPPTLTQDAASGNIIGTFQRSVFTDWVLNEPVDAAPTGLFAKPTTGEMTLAAVSPNVVAACSASEECAAGEICDLGFCSALPAHRFFPDPTTFTGHIMQHKRMTKWGHHWPVPGMFETDTSTVGHWAFYLPGAYAQALASQLRSGYTLHGPVSMISGEPLADIFNTDGSLLAANLPQRAIPLLTHHDSSFVQSASSLFRQCLTELTRERTQGPATPSNGAYMDNETFDMGAACINLGRVRWALNDVATFQRALQGWLDVHSFVLRQGVEEARLAEATAGIPGTQSTNDPIPLGQLLGVGESGLGFLIDFHNGPQNPFFFHTGTALAANVDYRPGKVGQTCADDANCNNGDGQITLRCDTGSQTCKIMTLSELPQHEQPIGVPTKILEAATAYLTALEMYLAKIARQTYGQPADANPVNDRQTALARFGTGMRLVLWTEQLARGINEKAPCGTGNPSDPNCSFINTRFAAVRDEMMAVRERVVAQAEAIRTGRNPFNIPEDDVPLFFGDPAGKNSRYFAASDYLLNAWAVPAVAQAESYLDAARSSWLSQLQAKAQDQLNVHSREQEIDQLMSKYGAPILDACGGIQVRTSGGGLRQLESTEVIPYFAANPTQFDSNSCFIDQACIGSNGVDSRIALRTVINDAFLDASGNLKTTVDNPTTGTSLAVATLFVQSEICKLTYTLGRDPNRNGFAGRVAQICPGNNWPSTQASGSSCSVVKGSDSNLYFTPGVGGGGVVVPVAAFYGDVLRSDLGPGKFYAQATVPPGQDPVAYAYYDVRTDDRPAGAPSLHATFARWFTEFGSEVCAWGAPESRLHNDYPRPDQRLLPARCYRGGLGVGVFEMHGSVLRAQQARDILWAGQKNLDDTFARCKEKDEHFAAIQSATDAYNGAKGDYYAIAAIGDLLGTIVTKGGGLSSLFSNVMGMFGVSRADEAEAIQQMEAAFGRQEDIQACWDDFRAQRRALTSAMDDIQIAVTTANGQAVQFQNMRRNNRLLLDEGIAVYKREKDSPLSSLAHVFWVDEKVEQFKKQFEWARRLAFLAMRAIEFEFQQSLPFRSQIVAATTPAQLQDVMIGLQQEQAARTINRRRPEEASVVVSLRDDVLAIGNRSGDPAGERNWTSSERFASRLWDDRYAVRDSNGDYLGQGIPFTLGPTGVLETRCGERLWRATATLQGDGIETSAPGASVLLLKRNTFSSQYCKGKSPPRTSDAGALLPGPQMQVGVVHTSAQLFKSGANVDLSDANQFTAAQLYPWFNVRRTDFYKTAYQDGASEELAGRGLYGDYVLLFPKQVLEDGFTLERVEDVLLRLDYLSVDNLSQ